MPRLALLTALLVLLAACALGAPASPSASRAKAPAVAPDAFAAGAPRIALLIARVALLTDADVPRPAGPVQLYDLSCGAALLWRLERACAQAAKAGLKLGGGEPVAVPSERLAAAASLCGEHVVALQNTQLTGEDDLGSFQSFPLEKAKYELYKNRFVSTVANSHYAARALYALSRLQSAPPRAKAAVSNFFAPESKHLVAALLFLENAHNASTYQSYPGARDPSVANSYHGVSAWKMFESLARGSVTPLPAPSSAQRRLIGSHLVPVALAGSDSAKLLAFRTDASASPSLQAAFFALSTLHTLNALASFRDERDLTPVAAFVLRHFDARERGFCAYLDCRLPECPDCAPVLPDVTSTWHAVAALTWLQPDTALPTGIEEFVLSLQSARDGTFAFDSAAASSARSALPKAFSPALGNSLAAVEILTHLDALVRLVSAPLAPLPRRLPAQPLMPSWLVTLAVALLLAALAALLDRVLRVRLSPADAAAAAEAESAEDEAAASVARRRRERRDCNACDSDSEDEADVDVAAALPGESGVELAARSSSAARFSAGARRRK